MCRVRLVSDRSTLPTPPSGPQVMIYRLRRCFKFSSWRVVQVGEIRSDSLGPSTGCKYEIIAFPTSTDAHFKWSSTCRVGTVGHATGMLLAWYDRVRERHFTGKWDYGISQTPIQ